LPVPDFPRGAPVENAYGECIIIEKPVPVDLGGVWGGGRSGASRISCNLQLVYGIGPVIEARLRAEGYNTLYDLLEHPRWAELARPVVEALDRGDGLALARLGVRDIELLSLCGPSDVVFVDVETTGLASTCPLFMIGMLLPESTHELRLVQAFARDYDEEAAVLEEARIRLAEARAVVTYNGKSFDMPFMSRRMAYHGRSDELEVMVVDLRWPTRRRWYDALPNCKLATVQSIILECPRDGDIPGRLIPEVYVEYVRTGDVSLVLPIIDHNELDLLAMAGLLPFLI
jgi:uncharacterized protein YprB with RNaseH-like and TPR domain